MKKLFLVSIFIFALVFSANAQNKNRTEVANSIEALSPIVSLSELKEALNDNFAQSVVFRKDVSASEVATDGTPSVDFTDIDYISLDLTGPPLGSFVITIAGVQQGEVKYLTIVKGANDIISFSGATDAAESPDYIATQTTVLYQLTNKDGTNIFATPISRGVGVATVTEEGIVEKATESERNSGTTDKFIDAELLLGNTAGLLKTVLDIGDWDMDASTSVTVVHGLTLSKIRRISTWIRNDAASVLNNLEGNTVVAGVDSGNNGAIGCDATNITLNRVTGGSFDAASFSTTSYNRGWIIIESTP